ncbi:hypothetical protein [Chitinophaga solisilvae]|uniref:hypothetical protein n=1 Tax=Chitinophaga solisilvae TaxID=1233460 RepID=UPI001371A0A5|nr:hypothetical protein [Chitinophaga solisilvae]
MTTCFPDYRQLVMRAYERKKVNNTLPLGLMHLTPANLKDECVKSCTKDVSRRDEKIIRDFCGDLNESKSYKDIIKRCDTDRFRPLVNYLKGKSENTDEKNIELLAWLIDFSGRPWEIGKKISGEEDVNEDPAPNDVNTVAEEEEVLSDAPVSLPLAGSELPAGNPVIPGNPIIPIIQAETEDSKRGEMMGFTTTTANPPRKLKEKSAKTLAAVMLSLVLGAGSIWWWQNRNQSGAGCMYWSEDHYEPIACDQKKPNVKIIAFDARRMENFKKITQPDTITYQAIGKVWYSKINNKMEYYTSGGEHPVAFDRELKPITAYIIDIHIRKITN